MFEITSKEIKEGFNEVHEELQAAIFSKEENFSEIKKTPVIVVLDNGEKVHLDLSRLRVCFYLRVRCDASVSSCILSVI